MKILRVFLILCIMQFAQSHGMGVGVSPAPPSIQPLPPIQDHEQPIWSLFNVGSEEELIAWLMQEVETKGVDQVISELSTKLSTSDMNKLYSILIREAYTEPLALRLWEVKEQKEKIESALQYDCLRIIIVAKSKQAPTEFWIGLSDGSFWQVEPYHMGGDDPSLQKIMINSLLGDCVTQVDPGLFEARSAKGLFHGLMNVKKMDQGVNLDDKDVFFLGYGGFMK